MVRNAFFSRNDNCLMHYALLQPRRSKFGHGAHDGLLTVSAKMPA